MDVEISICCHASVCSWNVCGSGLLNGKIQQMGGRGEVALNFAVSVIYDAHCISSNSDSALSDVQRFTPMSHRVRRVPTAQQEKAAPRAPR